MKYYKYLILYLVMLTACTTQMQPTETKPPVISAAEVLEYQRVEIPESIENKKCSIWGFYDKDQLLVSLFQESAIGMENPEIGVFDLKQMEYRQFIPEKSDAMLNGIGVYNSDYIAYWMQKGQGAASIGDNPQPLEVSLWLFDVKKKQDIPVHKNEPWSLGNKVVLWEDKLYFDDFRDDSKEVAIYCYDIKTQKKEKIKDGWKEPIIYGNDIIVLGKSDGEEYDTLYHLNGEKVTKLPENRSGLCAANKKIYVARREVMEGVVVHSILEEVLSGRELMQTQPDTDIGRIGCNEEYVWWGSASEIPMIYSMKKDALLQFDKLPKSEYNFMIYGDSGLLRIYPEDKTQEHKITYYFKSK